MFYKIYKSLIPNSALIYLTKQKYRYTTGKTTQKTMKSSWEKNLETTWENSTQKIAHW